MQQTQVRRCRGSRRTWRARQYRPIAEELARAIERQNAFAAEIVAGGDADAALQHNVQTVAGVALSKDRVVFADLVLLEQARDFGQLLMGQVGKDVHRTQEIDHLCSHGQISLAGALAAQGTQQAV